MIKTRNIIAIAVTSLLAASAYAQNPAGTSAAQGNEFNTKAQQAAEARKSARPNTPAPSQLHPSATGVAGTAIPSGRAVEAGEARHQTRDARRPGHTAPSQLMPENGVASTGIPSGKSVDAAEARRQAREAQAPK